MDVHIFSQQDAAHIVGVPFYKLEYAIRVGNIPRPSVVVGWRKYFTKDDIIQINEYFTQKKEGTCKQE